MMRSAYESLSLSETEFAILRDLILERTGIFFENGRRDVLADKLTPRALERGLESFIDYYYFLKYDPGGEGEWGHVLDALSVQETYFWREMDQIRTLVDAIVPRHFSEQPETPLRIWSAACATGEEPLTIAMALDEAGWFQRGSIQIRASDGSAAAISRAREGNYRERSFRKLPMAFKEKYFTEAAGVWRVIASLHDRVQWGLANLSASQEVARFLPAQVIFCRNAFIYFSPQSIARTVALFAQGMPSPGYLFVGASESLLKLTTEFELREINCTFVYVKP